MAGIDSFKGTFVDMARANRFRCEGFGLGGDLEFLAKGAQLPGSTMGAMDVPYQGRIVKMPGDRIFNDWTMTIYNDTDMSMRKLFEDWMELLNGNESNVGSTVKRDGTIQQLGRDGSVLATFDLRGCMPIDVSPIDVAFDSNDTPSEMSVTLAYDYHVMS